MTITEQRPPAGLRVKRRRRAPVVVRHSAHHGLVLVAAGLAVLLSVTVLAALVALTEHAAQTGARQRLAAEPDASIRVTGRYDPAGVPRADTDVRRALGGVFGDVPHRTETLLRAPFANTGQLPAADGTMWLTLLGVAGPERHARLDEGRWPRQAAGGPVEVALDRGYARRFGLRPGSEAEFGGEHGPRLTVRVTGTYTPRDAGSVVWHGMTGTFGVPDSVALAHPGSFAAIEALRTDAAALWIGVPDARRLELGELDGLRERVPEFAASRTDLSVFGGRAPPLKEVRIDSQLGFALRQLDIPVAVARAGMYLPSALLAALAAAALVLTARQLVRHRAAEQALLGARGAGWLRLTGGAAAQWALIAVPAAVAAPLLAVPLLRLLRGTGLLDTELPRTAATAAGWWVAGIALAVHGTAVLVPVARAARDRRTTRRLRLRAGRFAAAQRTGADLALAGVAVLGWLQLLRYRTPLADSGSLDPVLILAPVAMTAATVLLSLRLMPLAGRAVDRLARRASGLVLPLGGWQLGRRTQGHAGPVLLVALALAVASLSGTALAILDRGDQDQAVFRTGADLRAEPGDDAAGFTPRSGRHSRYAALPGVAAVTPVVSLSTLVGAESAGITALDTAGIAATQRAGSPSGPVPAFRADLAGGQPLDKLLGSLGEGVKDHGILLPGRPRSLDLRARVAADGPGTPVPLTLELTLEDGDGLGHTVRRELPPLDGRERPFTIPFDPASQYPLRITAIRLSVPPGEESVRRTYRVLLDGLDAQPVRWRDGFAGRAPSEWLAGCPGAVKPRFLEGLVPASGLLVCDDRTGPGELFDGVLRGPQLDLPRERLIWRVDLEPAVRDKAAPVPALVDDVLAAGGLARPGDTVTFLLDGREYRARIVGRIGGIPGFDRTEGRLLMDTRALAAALTHDGRPPPREAFWWMSAKGGDASAALTAARAEPGLGAVTDIPGERRALADGPLRASTNAALVLCLILAPAFAVVGFTLHTVLSARSRGREFALLRALGVRPRQLTAVLWTEQLSLALFAALTGTVTGTALATAITPVVAVDDTGSPVFPSLTVTVPWGWVLPLAPAVVLLICLAVTAGARVLAGADMARVLRAGEDR
ncbi:ABC transporter permease [Streptomyces sp. NPDC051940]|uniref:ABC transporter permease n=1 Tax=Streptomyces sp. NPDC051940 TaxID=3155675 RepID=UPI0034240AF8